MIGKNGVVFPTDNSRITFQLKSGTYKFTQFITGSATTNVDVRLKDENTNIFYKTGASITLTETHTFTINILILGTDNKNAEIKVQLEEGSSASEYEEYYNYELARIPNTNYQDYFYKTSGKNLLPNYRLTTRTTNNVTYTNNGNGTINLSGTSNAYTQFIDDTSFTLPAGTYTICSPNLSGYITLNLRSTDGNTTYANTGATTTSKLYATFTLAEETEMKFRVVMQNNSQTNVSIMPMIISGEFTTMPTYEPYGTGEWYKKENIGKFIINGSESYTFEVDTNSYNYPRYTIYNFDTDYSSQTSSITSFSNLASYCVNPGGYTNYNESFIVRYISGQKTRVDLMSSSLGETTANGFKTWLGTHNLEVRYIKATSNDIEITNETLIEQLNNLEKLKSYNGTTNISSSGNLSAILGVSAIKGE